MVRVLFISARKLFLARRAVSKMILRTSFNFRPKQANKSIRWVRGAVENLIHICFVRSVSISIPSTPIEFRALGHCVLSTTHFRLVVYISTPRYSSKFRVLREKSPIEIILPTPLTHFNHSTKTNILKGSF